MLKKMDSKKSIRIVSALLLIFFSFILLPHHVHLQEKPVTLKAISAFPQANRMNDAFWMLQKKFKDKSRGRGEIIWGGGPEAIPTFQLVEAIRNGVIDLAWTAHTFNVAQLAVAEGAKLSKLTPSDERKKGVYEFYQKAYQARLNAYFLGKGTPGLTYNLYTTVPVMNLGDFKGMTIRVTPAYKAFVEALGAAPVTTDPGEVFNALQRRMVQGYGWPSVGISDFGWDEVTKFVIEPAFYQVDVIALIHINTWNRLPKDLQEIMNISIKEVEQEAYEHFRKLISDDREKIKQKGIKEIKLSGEEGEKYFQMAYDAAWKEVIKKDASLGAQLKDLLGK